MQKLLRALPHTCMGQRIHHLYDGWNFEMRQVVATVLKHGFHIGLDVGLEHEERLHRLIANRVINADDRHLGKARECIENLFNLRGGNIFASALNHVGLAIDEIHPAILVEVALIAERIQPLQSTQEFVAASSL